MRDRILTDFDLFINPFGCDNYSDNHTIYHYVYIPYSLLSSCDYVKYILIPKSGLFFPFVFDFSDIKDFKLLLFKYNIYAINYIDNILLKVI